MSFSNKTEKESNKIELPDEEVETPTGHTRKVDLEAARQKWRPSDRGKFAFREISTEGERQERVRRFIVRICESYLSSWPNLKELVGVTLRYSMLTVAEDSAMTYAEAGTFVLCLRQLASVFDIPDVSRKTANRVIEAFKLPVANEAAIGKKKAWRAKENRLYSRDLRLEQDLMFQRHYQRRFFGTLENMGAEPGDPADRRFRIAFALVWGCLDRTALNDAADEAVNQRHAELRRQGAA